MREIVRNGKKMFVIGMLMHLKIILKQFFFPVYLFLLVLTCFVLLFNDVLIFRTICNNFITERNSSEVMAIGLNAVRFVHFRGQVLRI